eukprot:Polyplicarium_translucidae@DN3304_c1_g1_i2.p3
MNVMDPLVDDSPYKPLSLPVWFEPAVGTSEGIDYGEYLRSDWIDAVKSRIENGPPGGDVGQFLDYLGPRGEGARRPGGERDGGGLEQVGGPNGHGHPLH